MIYLKMLLIFENENDRYIFVVMVSTIDVKQMEKEDEKSGKVHPTKIIQNLQQKMEISFMNLICFIYFILE